MNKLEADILMSKISQHKVLANYRKKAENALSHLQLLFYYTTLMPLRFHKAPSFHLQLHLVPETSHLFQSALLLTQL